MIGKEAMYVLTQSDVNGCNVGASCTTFYACHFVVN